MAPLAGRERTLPGIAAALAAGQLALHTVFGAGQMCATASLTPSSDSGGGLLSVAARLVCDGHGLRLTPQSARQIVVNAGLDRPTRLIEYFDVLPSTITFETDKLVAAGLIVRDSDPNDRRVVRLSLTPAGRAVHRETTRAINAELRPRLAAIPPAELEQFLATFKKIVDPLHGRASPEPDAD